MAWRGRAARIGAPIWHRLGGPAQWALVWVSQPLFLVAVCGVVRDQRGRVLLLQPRFWPRGSWGLPAGYVKHRETIAEAFSREVREETGLTVEGMEIVEVISGYRRRVEFLCTAHLSGGRPQCDPLEVLDAGWFSLDRLPPGLLTTHLGHVRAVTGGEPGAGGRLLFKDDRSAAVHENGEP